MQQHPATAHGKSGKKTDGHIQLNFLCGEDVGRAEVSAKVTGLDVEMTEKMQTSPWVIQKK